MQTLHKLESSGMMVTVLRLVGFLLVFVAALVFVIGTSPPAGCYVTSPSTTCALNWANGYATSVLVGKLLGVLGAAAIIGGSALRLQYGLKPNSDTKPEEYRYLIHERRFNGLLVILLILVLFLVMFWIPALPGGLPPP
ncbi:MAG: hypothetical protein ACREDE_10045 [Thermoplasmata archaeon]